jgi:hypothetical protein
MITLNKWWPGLGEKYLFIHRPGLGKMWPGYGEILDLVSNLYKTSLLDV